jgi:phenylacetate-CoA ligase
MLIIARLARRLHLELPRPKALIVSAETLFPQDRCELKAAFGCQVYNQYAASEPSCFWCDCEEGLMHINPEYGISEIVGPNGQAVPPGKPGDVVVTSFLNPVMPLIRYRLGDVAVAGSDTRCACGRQMPRIERVVGRVDDILFVPSRGYVGRLDPAFKGLDHVIEAQIVQESLAQIRVLVVPDKGFDTRAENRLVSNLRTKLGDEVEIEVEQVACIPRGPNGKFRSVISKVKHLYPDGV